MSEQKLRALQNIEAGLRKKIENVNSQLDILYIKLQNIEADIEQERIDLRKKETNDKSSWIAYKAYCNHCGNTTDMEEGQTEVICHNCNKKLTFK